MTPQLRKLNLTAHDIFSVGWLGVVAAFQVLAIAALVSQDDRTVRAAYLAMELIWWFAIIPFSLAALLTGLVQSLGTQWGLFRHYWVLVKFLLTIGAIIALLVHTNTLLQAISAVSSGVAAEALSGAHTLASAHLGKFPVRIQVVVAAGATLLVLLALTALSVYKPWGRTRYGRRKLHEQREQHKQP